eukprot:968888-Prymnesium_polylepis.1
MRRNSFRAPGRRLRTAAVCWHSHRDPAPTNRCCLLRLPPGCRSHRYPPWVVGTVRGTSLPVARFHTKEALEGTLVLAWFAAPVLERNNGAEPRQPHVPLTTDIGFQRSSHKVAAVSSLTAQDDHTCLRLPQLAHLLRVCGRVLRKAHHHAERETSLLACKLHRSRTTRTVSPRGVRKCHRGVAEQILQNIDERRRNERIRRDNAEERWIHLAITEFRAKCPRRYNGDALKRGHARSEQ